FFFSSGRRHTIFSRDWSSDVCSSDLRPLGNLPASIFVATAVSHILTQIRHFQRTNENIDFFHTNAWRNQISCHSHLAKVSRSDERSARHRPTFHNERLAS